MKTKLELFKTVFSQAYSAQAGISVLMEGRDELTVGETGVANTLNFAGEMIKIAGVCGCDSYIGLQDGKPVVKIF